MSDLAHHQTKTVQLIFLGMRKSDIIFLRFLIHSYCNQKMRVKWNGSLSGTFSASLGVKQGGCTIAIAIYCLSGSAYFSTQRVGNWLPSEWHVCGCIHLCR